MVEHTDNQKKRENKTAFYYIGYRQANVSRISALISCLEIITASNRPFVVFFYDRQQQQRQRQTDKTDCLTPLTHTRRGVKLPVESVLLSSLITSLTLIVNRCTFLCVLPSLNPPHQGRVCECIYSGTPLKGHP